MWYLMWFAAGVTAGFISFALLISTELHRLRMIEKCARFVVRKHNQFEDTAEAINTLAKNM